MTYRVRAASSKTWNSPLSRTVSKVSPSDEVERVEHREAGVGATLGGLAAGEGDGAREDVDAEHRGAVARGEDRMLAGAAASVEQRAVEQAKSLREPNEGGPRAAHVPRRRRPV